METSLEKKRLASQNTTSCRTRDPETLTGNSTLVMTLFESPPDNPLILLDHWLKEAHRMNIREPNAMSLTTVDAQNGFTPSSRFILLKGLTPVGITFGTSETSQKGQNIKTHPVAAGNLYWRETLQQISFGGRVEKLSSSESDLNFKDRTREAKAVAIISQQSAILRDEEELTRQIYQFIENENVEMTRPRGWHGYHLLFDWVEFWVGVKTRIHQRLRYDLVNGAWKLTRLQP
ncbi:MAG: pyridoxamine 5'-phosphate oxidase [Alphaproteobacteria bacterium 16-39-46]|nr:MAG: pyridoxamine 5'-phosphate oxidase [Alphaproteobacteria bacterium 16-39-46]OZA44418.1 MAG: pyridoxamine 5'-phosphate oxidase [Alphaproteobacteria bacterium 17-39-52]HQS83305.1 pyridoxal 5'-phosphate synthase [Alphaproteobacteria bacterium]HQS93153.1 pyridoxal 5'-phosphate synthase [Alphaproteobacteria bacterium]